MRNVARSIVGAAGGDLGPATPTRPDPPTAPDVEPGIRRGDRWSKGPAIYRFDRSWIWSQAGRTGCRTGQGKAKLCKAYLASKNKEHGKQMGVAGFERLAEAAEGVSRIPAYCNGTQPGDPKSKDEKQQPPGGQEQGQSEPRPATAAARGRASRRPRNRPIVEPTPRRGSAWRYIVTPSRTCDLVAST